MIRSEGSKVMIKGTKKELLTDFMLIAHSLMENGVAERKELMETLVLALMTEDEIKKMFIEAIDEMDDIGTALNMLGELEYMTRKSV